MTFDIDADGIVNVSAKDMATGKAQSIKITASSGLTKSEIEKLVREAELNAEEDRRKRALVDVRNQADALIYSTEKTLQEQKVAIDSRIASEVESALLTLKSEMTGEDAAAITQKSKRLTGWFKRFRKRRINVHPRSNTPTRGTGRIAVPLLRRTTRRRKMW